jgi:hypothetical protein
MDSEQMFTIVAFTLKAQRLLILLLFSSGLLQVCFSQVLRDDKQAKDILRLSQPEQINFVESMMEQGFPETDGDKFAILLVNRSALVIPLVESKLEDEIQRSPRSEKFIDIASEMIAYAGDEESLRAISKLISIDEKKFGRLVGRTLGNSANWRNPFTVAYQALEIGDDAITRLTIAWSESALASDRMKQRLAEAMLDRYGKVPGQAEWAQDPLASRLESQNASRLKERVTTFAADALERRRQQ